MAPRTNPTPWEHHTRPGRHGFPKATARRIIRRDKTCQLAYPGVCVGTPRIADHVVGWADACALRQHGEASERAPFREVARAISGLKCRTG